MFDGGFAMGDDLELYGSDEQVRDVTTSSGGTGQVGGNSSFGSMSSGGLY
jgi:penicillin-binding protein 1A